MNKEKSLRCTRIVLNQNNCKNISTAIDELNNENCRLSPSDFVNLCTEIFIKKYLPKEISEFEKKFFDRKKYLKMMLQEDNLENFKTSLKHLNTKIETSKRPKLRSKKNEENSTTNTTMGSKGPMAI